MQKLRQLGRSSLKISPIMFGGCAIGGWLWGKTSENDALNAICKSLDLGINAIDTAPLYGLGLSEKLIAKAIKNRRSEVIIASKCGLRWDTQNGSNPWHEKDLNGNNITIVSTLKPKSIFQEFEESAKRLNVDVIDLYQIHRPDPSTPIEEAWDAMVRLKNEGKVRAIGVSNFNLEQLKKAQAIHQVDSLQPHYSLVRRNIEDGVIPFCKENNISIIAYSPLERGLLTGKISADHEFKEGDHRATSKTLSKENRIEVLKAYETLRPLIDYYKITFAQLIIYCTFNLEEITSAIVGIRNESQAIENAKAMDLKISAEEQKLVYSTLKNIKL